MFAVHLFDKTADHHLGSVEVRNHAVFQRTDGLDARVGTLVHQLGFLAQGDAGTGLVIDGHDARLVQYNLVVLENHGIGRSKVDSELL